VVNPQINKRFWWK